MVSLHYVVNGSICSGNPRGMWPTLIDRLIEVDSIMAEAGVQVTAPTARFQGYQEARVGDVRHEASCLSTPLASLPESDS